MEIPINAIMEELKQINPLALELAMERAARKILEQRIEGQQQEAANMEAKTDE